MATRITAPPPVLDQAASAAATARTNAAKATTIASLRAEVERLASAVELLIKKERER